MVAGAAKAEERMANMAMSWNKDLAILNAFGESFLSKRRLKRASRLIFK